MKRQIEIQLNTWKKSIKRKPLLLHGARQIGKTFVLKEFASKKFKKTHYFDLEEQKVELEGIFNNLKPAEIINKLSFISGNSINIQGDILIFDEIQAIPRAITSLKYFNQEIPELAVAACGSNLGIAITGESFPVGKVECLTMYPMNFLEFLEGINEDVAVRFLKSFNGEVLDDVYHNRFFELLKIYFITGGMPDAIIIYKANKEDLITTFSEVRKYQKQLLIHYANDFSKYSGAVNSRHIERVFNSIPAQLSRTQQGNSKKFKFKNVISNGFRTYEDLANPIDWLVKTGLIFKINIVEHPSIPLLSGIVQNSFKLFFFDVGLLGAAVGLEPNGIMLYDYGTYKRYFAENFILQELSSYNCSSMVSWVGRTSEVEFLLQNKGRIIPVEVKAGTNTKAKSLQAYIAKYQPEYSVKFTGKKYGYDKKNTFSFPLYMVSVFMKQIYCLP